MVSFIGIVLGIAAVLAVIVTSLFIGGCLAVARITDAVRGRPQGGARAPQGGPRGEGDARPEARPAVGSGRHGGYGTSAAPWRGDR